MQDTGNFDVLSFGAVILSNGVPDIPVVYRAVSAGAALMPTGEIQLCSRRGKIARLIPIVGFPKIGDCFLAVVTLFLVAVLFQGKLGIYPAILRACSSASSSVTVSLDSRYSIMSIC